MKIISNIVAPFLLTLICISSFAQIPLDVKTIDLSANGKSKNARFVTASYNKETKEAKLTFVKTYCDGEVGGGYFTANDVVYNFEHLLFGNDFGFKTLAEEKLIGLQNTILKYPVLGKNFELKNRIGYVQGANREGTSLTQYNYSVKTYAGVNNIGYGCTQKVEAKKNNVILPFKGEGFLGFELVTDGVITVTYAGMPAIANIRLYSNDGTQKMEKKFPLADYGFATKILPLKTAAGHNDLVMIIQPTKKYNKYGIKVETIKESPLEFEYIRVDGITLEVKERFSFNAVNTQWYPEHIFEKDGSVYVMGQSAAKVEMMDYYFGGMMTIEGGNFQNYLRIDELENFQILKATNGKLNYVNAFTPSDLEKIQTPIPGTKGSNNPTGYFRKQEIKIINNSIYITGQFTKPGKSGDDRKAEFMLVLNNAGKPTNLFYIPKKNYANAEMFVSADQKSLLWAVYDYSEYDITATRLEPTQIKIGFVMGGSDHTFMGKRKNDDGPELQLVKIDLTNNTPSQLQVCGKDEYTLFDDTPVLYANENEVAFFGVAGKNKERVAKVIKVKL